MSLSSRQWKWILATIGLLIVTGSALSAGYLVQQLAEEERHKVERWVEAQRYIRTMTDAEAEICDLTIYTTILQSNSTIPLILVGPTGEIIDAHNFGESLDSNTTYLTSVLSDLRTQGVAPIEGAGGNQIYFFESSLLRSLRYFPYIQLLLIGTFILLGYLALSAIRRSEQNGVWIGMAKETAHQLGTPISAIMAWVEYLRAEYGDNEELSEVASELNRDVDRLQLVADRFNKIGSKPELEAVPLGEVLQEVFDYMSKRAPRKVAFTCEVDAAFAKTPIAINRHIFNWVLENLIRNALDAMDGSGTLELRGTIARNLAEIEVADSGKGIPPNKRKTVFRPGYTTKSRGWGLGLSLAKRIVEQYHGGKIFVKDSAVGRGTTFAVRVPLAPKAPPSSLHEDTRSHLSDA